MQERMDVLSKVDGNESRLMGFLNWNMHNLYIEKVAFCQRTESMNNLNLEEMTKGLERTLERSSTLLALDGSCPEELKIVLKIQATSQTGSS